MVKEKRVVSVPYPELSGRGIVQESRTGLSYSRRACRLVSGVVVRGSIRNTEEGIGDHQGLRGVTVLTGELVLMQISSCR